MTGKWEPGCYIDSHWGHVFGTTRLVGLANDAGMQLSAPQIHALAVWGAGVDGSEAHDDTVTELANQAENYLNEHVATEGFSFGWYDGEFFYWSAADWEAS